MLRLRTLRTLGTLLMLVVGCLTASASRALGDSDTYAKSGDLDKTLSPYFMVVSDDPEKDVMPLKSTRADVKIAGMVAEVKVTQVYRNHGKKTLEAVYVFPGSTRAAINAMRMTIGARVIEAEIMERQKAREIYATAKKAGKTTSLLEQQRPNVFQMNVANILPGDEIKVELTYMELLQPEDKVYEFVYPTVVGPRYTTKTAAGAQDNDKWVENPYLHAGEPPPYAFGLNVELLSPLPIDKLASPSHAVEINYTGKTAAQIKIKDEKTAGTRDFVLRYSLAGGQINSGLLLYPGQEENFFLMMMEPPARVAAKEVLPREYIFIVDVSGSMHGFPLDTAKALMRDLIKGLTPKDFMNVLLFAGGAATLSPSGSLPATEANKQKALDFIKAQSGGGGTNLVPAMEQALALPRTPGVSRIVTVATDGYVDVEPRAFQLIRDNLGAANLFAFGIGTSVNRHLIEGMARAGLGESFVVRSAGEAAKQAARFRSYIANPVLTDIKVTLEDVKAYDVEPQAVPDLFALRPITILGKYRGSPAGAVVVKGRTAQGEFVRTIKLADASASQDNAALRCLWARQRILNLADFASLERGNQNQEMIKEVTALGLKYSLMTPYTSFVAVDKLKRADGQLVTVKQPLPLPEGVSDLAIGVALPAPSALGATRAFRSGLAPEVAMARKPKTGGAKPDAAGGGVTLPPTAAVTVTIQDVQTTGALSAAAVRQVLEAQVAKLARCCQAAATRASKLPATLTLVFTVETDGKVSAEPVGKPPLASQELESCLAKALRSLQFPSSPQASTRVTVTLNLSRLSAGLPGGAVR
jgi:Ca-activated chloride channel homolog